MWRPLALLFKMEKPYLMMVWLRSPYERPEVSSGSVLALAQGWPFKTENKLCINYEEHQ